jgi:glycosyltransferase involved in cell wall biosynthesis
MIPSLSLVIPAYNEAARLGATLRTVLSYLAQSANTELIVVDDGSTDGTSSIIQDALARGAGVQTRLIRYDTNRGKGYAVRAGLLAARAPIAVFSDADLSTPIAELPKLVNVIERGDCDLAFGSRALDRSLIGTHQSWLRETGGRVFNLLLRFTTALPFSDTQCGFKAFRMGVCRPIIEAGNIDRFGFDVELLYVAHRAGLRLLEIPVRWNHCEGSKVSVGRDSLRMLGEVLTIRRRAAFGAYGQTLAGTRAAVRHEEGRLGLRA